MFFSKSPDRDKIDAALQESGAQARLEGLEITSAGDVIVTLRADIEDPGAMESLRQIVENKVSAVKHVSKVMVILTAERAPEPPPADMSSKGKKIDLPNIKKIIAVASGKGGVGKSTVAANLAVALAQNGQRVGLMDADIYGPSVPRLMGVSGKPDMNDKRLVPFEKHGIKFMSMGFLVAEDAAMIWRGPMIQTAVTQLLRDVEWGELDVLVIDLPPGTGDAQLTMAQKVSVSGAVIVSTPQDLALIDARKAIEMFRKLDVPILGLVENMSYHVCMNCGHEDHVFGHGGAKAEAEKQAIPFLGEIPLNGEIRRLSDEGVPVASSENPASKIYHSFAEQLLTRI